MRLLKLGLAGAFSLSLSSPLMAESSGNPDFHLVCRVGSKAVRITTESDRLVYRFGGSRRVELEIMEDQKAPNLFYRYDLLGVKGGGQQLRFTSGRYSYGISSWFIAGPSGEEGLAFFLLKDGKLVKWRACKGDDWFTEDNQLKRLPRDPLWVNADGVQTGEIPGVTPWRL